MNKQLPEEIRIWLNNRGIKDYVIDRYDISFKNDKIVLPVHDQAGNILFNKYRRSPNSTTGPKYQYDKGSTSALYGLQTFMSPVAAVICEGELDCLALLSNHIVAVSSTGGSGTFEKEWKNYFLGVDTYICYDNDEAGIKGAFHVQSIIPWAKIIWLPKQVGDHGDVTDFFVKLGKTADDFLTLRKEAKTYRMPSEWKKSTSKQTLKQFELAYKEAIDGYMQDARELREKYHSDKHLQVLIQMYMSKLAEVQRAIKYFNKAKDISGDKIARAKAVPIPQFINFNKDNVARCIWHNEKTPSMYYYEKQNRVKCFGCDKLGDVIDVVQQLKKVNLSEALKIILNEKTS